MEFFDSHSHYNDEKFNEDREEIIKKTKEEGITRFICAGYDIESSKKAIDIAKQYDFINAIVGISPNDVPENKKEIENFQLSTSEKYNKIEQLTNTLNELKKTHNLHNEKKQMNEKDNSAKKADLLSLLPEELEALIVDLGEPKYRAKQLFSPPHLTAVFRLHIQTVRVEI